MANLPERPDGTLLVCAHTALATRCVKIRWLSRLEATAVRCPLQGPLAAYQVRVGDPGSRRSAGRRMTTMAVIGITGSTDGIGRAAARVLLADGHRVLVSRTQSGAGRARREAHWEWADARQIVRSPIELRRASRFAAAR